MSPTPPHTHANAYANACAYTDAHSCTHTFS